MVRKRNSQRGNALLLAMIVLTSLATLGSLTVVSVQGGIATSNNDRFHATAVYAAESGGAVAMDFLRKNVNLATGWGAYVSPNNQSPVKPGIPGNNAVFGSPGNLFSQDVRGSYSVEIYNNRTDPGFAAGTDSDARVIIRSTGYGPDGAIAILEWEISATSITGLGRPCPSYAQKGESEDGSGRNDCMGSINAGDIAVIQPGG